MSEQNTSQIDVDDAAQDNQDEATETQSQDVFTEDVTPYTLARTAEAVANKLGLTKKAPTPNQLYGYARKSVEKGGAIVSGISAYDRKSDGKRFVTAATANSWMIGFVQGRAAATGSKVDFEDLAEKFVASQLA